MKPWQAANLAFDLITFGILGVILWLTLREIFCK